jgi:hypothetical protein
MSESDPISVIMHSMLKSGELFDRQHIAMA